MSNEYQPVEPGRLIAIAEQIVSDEWAVCQKEHDKAEQRSHLRHQVGSIALGALQAMGCAAPFGALYSSYTRALRQENPRDDGKSALQ